MVFSKLLNLIIYLIIAYLNSIIVMLYLIIKILIILNTCNQYHIILKLIYDTTILRSEIHDKSKF
jgi:hypothetical protein